MTVRPTISLRVRTLITILAVLVPGTAAFLLVERSSVSSSFQAVERSQARRDAARCAEGLAGEVDSVRRVASDYGQWDDSYEFMQGRSQAFITSNLSVETFAVNKLEVVWYLAPDGGVVFGRCYDLGTREAVVVPELPATFWPASHPLLGGTERRPVSGFYGTARGTLVVATRPITASDGTGTPRGTLVMGRFLAPATVQALSERVRVDFSVLPVQGPGAVEASIRSELETGDVTALREADGDLLLAHRLVRDVRGAPLLVVRAVVAREISAQGRAAALWAGSYGILIAAGILLALYRFFGRNVVRPVTALGERVRAIAAELGSATTLRLPVERRDELGRLAEDVNLLLSSLDETRLRLEEARTGAEAASAAKGRFVAHMSHELRTPISGIVGMTEVLLRSSLDPDQRRCAETVKVCADALLSVVGDVLDISKIEAGRLELERLDVPIREVLDQALAVVGHAAGSKGLDLRVEVEPDVPARIETDPTRLRQVLVNLLGNAVKFTARGAVTVRVALAHEAGAAPALRFAVTDSGIGIPPDRLPLLFQPFQQGESSTNRRFGGTGLGLAISRGIVRALGGSMGAESVEGQGATFWFTVPCVEAPTRPVVAAGPEPREIGPGVAACRRLRVLVAEDNAVNQEVVRRLLEGMGHEVALATNGRRAVDLTRSRAFDLVLMDLQMPEMDGYEAAGTIRVAERASGGRRRLPIVALTASATTGERERCRRVGMDEVLSKPVRQPELERVLRGIADRGEPAEIPSPAPLSSASGGSATRPRAFDLSDLGLPPESSTRLAVEVADLFRRHAPARLASLRTAAEAGDAGELARQAHALKGSCLHLHAPEAVAVLAEVEDAARGGDAEVGRARLAAIEARIGALLEEAGAIHQPV